MDVAMDVLDTFVFDRLYAAMFPISPDSFNTTELASLNQNVNRYISLAPSKWAAQCDWPRDNIYRQCLSMFLIVWFWGNTIYFVCSTLSFHFVYDKRAMQRPKFLRNQISLEIKHALSSMPGMAALTAPFFVAEIRGHSRLYDFAEEAPFPLYTYLQYPLFIAFTDFGIYWIHRGLHHPAIYKHLHKSHHRWIIATPYASYAFHPLDGWSQSVPYHVFPLLFPLQKIAYLGLFVFVTIWTVMIHDGEYATNSPIINSSACHTTHHYYFHYNYGQFTTLWDRIGGSYRKPDAALFDREHRHGEDEIRQQLKEMERRLTEANGEDDQSHQTGPQTKKNL